METANSIDDGLVNERFVARFLGVSVATVRRMRLLRRGPRYIKVGASVRYRLDDLKVYRDSRPSGGGE